MLHLQGPWKRKNLAEYGIVTQCMAPQRVNDQYLTNVLLKINAKVSYCDECSLTALPLFPFLAFLLLVAYYLLGYKALVLLYCQTCLIFFLMLQLGGLNSILAVEHSPSIPIVSKAPTIILGMDVSHGSPGQSDIPSIAAVILILHFSVLSLYLSYY